MAWKAGHADDWQNVKRRGWKQIRTALTEEKEVRKGFQFSCIQDSIGMCVLLSVCAFACLNERERQRAGPKRKGP